MVEGTEDDDEGDEESIDTLRRVQSFGSSVLLTAKSDNSSEDTSSGSA